MVESSRSVGASAMLPSVNVSSPGVTVRGALSPPGQNKLGPPHADGSVAPAVE